MSDDPNKQQNWDRDEVRTDSGDNPETPAADEDAEVPTWNEGQMAEQHKDGSRSVGPTDEEIVEESAGGLSGGGVNPGGGERWAERDKK